MIIRVREPRTCQTALRWIPGFARRAPKAARPLIGRSPLAGRPRKLYFWRGPAPDRPTHVSLARLCRTRKVAAGLRAISGQHSASRRLRRNRGLAILSPILGDPAAPGT
jgi:hypothetical protein